MNKKEYLKNETDIESIDQELDTIWKFAKISCTISAILMITIAIILYIILK